MKAFELSTIAEERERTQQRYHEFLRAQSMSAGLYHLKAGQTDPQRPHSQDELYYVEHRFHAITEGLDILVFFAPAEG